jgi:hypothetical protein
MANGKYNFMHAIVLEKPPTLHSEWLMENVQCGVKSLCLKFHLKEGLGEA